MHSFFGKPADIDDFYRDIGSGLIILAAVNFAGEAFAYLVGHTVGVMLDGLQQSLIGLGHKYFIVRLLINLAFN